jgi:hypothetical protein
MSDGDDNVATDGIGRSELSKAYEFVIFTVNLAGAYVNDLTGRNG